MIEKRVCIVGLGLMGGSLALALRGKVVRLAGVDPDAATRQRAREMGLVDFVTAVPAEAICTADLVILATPVKTILALLEALPTLCPDGCLVLDLGSTKRNISKAMEALPPQFAAVGGHPMCGKEMSGLAAAEPELYQDQTFVLTRNGRTTSEIESLALEIIAAVGAQPLFLEAARHDDIVAAVSHLPYLASATLVQSAAELDEGRVWAVSASGFRDAARLAGSDPRMMLDILQTNKTAVLTQLARYQAALTAVAELLNGDDETALLDWLSRTQAQHAAYQRAKAAQHTISS